MSLRRYRDTKPSGALWLGDIPSSWHVKRLKYLCAVLPSNVDKKTYEGELPVKLCNYTDAYYNEEITADLEFMPATATPEQVSRFALRSGDSIVTKDSETSDDIAVASYVPKDLPGVVCGYHLAIVRPEGPIDGRYVKRLFDSRYLKSRFDVAANGLTRVGLSQYAFDNVEIPLPPSEEQKQIVAFLEQETHRLDELVSEQDRLIELLREKRQAVISHAVTKGLNRYAPMKPSGIQWLGSVPAQWKVVGLTKYLASVVDYRGRTPTKADAGVYLVTAKNITAGRIDYEASEEYILPSEYDQTMSRGKPAIGDVLFTTEAPLGEVANVDRVDVALAQRIIKFRGVDKVLDNHFLKYWIMGSFCQADLVRLATGSTALGIKGSKVGQLRLCLPPIEEQVEIVGYLDTQTLQIDRLTSEANRAIELLKERRGAVISAAVTGQIDVHEPVTVEMA